MKSVKHMLQSERGQGMTEYIIIAVLVALVVLFSINRFGAALRTRFGQATATVGSVNVSDTGNQDINADGEKDPGVPGADVKFGDGSGGK
jgi:Flp pilus assembly pilin Flp